MAHERSLAMKASAAVGMHCDVRLVAWVNTPLRTGAPTYLREVN